MSSIFVTAGGNSALTDADADTAETTHSYYSAFDSDVGAVFKAYPVLAHLSIDIDYEQNRKHGQRYVNGVV